MHKLHLLFLITHCSVTPPFHLRHAEPKPFASNKNRFLATTALWPETGFKESRNRKRQAAACSSSEKNRQSGAGSDKNRARASKKGTLWRETRKQALIKSLPRFGRCISHRITGVNTEYYGFFLRKLRVFGAKTTQTRRSLVLI